MKPDITLIAPPSPFLLNQKPYPPLGILYLSSYLKAYGLETQCLDFGFGHTIDMVESNTVGISINSFQKKEAFDIAKQLKKQRKTLIAGGPHATHLPQECYDVGFDHVVKGYGEGDLLRYLVPGLDSTLNFVDHIDMAPMPDRDALPVKEYDYQIDGVPATTVMTSRGCPYRCSFCAKISDNFQQHSATRVTYEIEMINRNYGFEAFMIFDDVFVANKKRLSSISEYFQTTDYIFRCFARSNLLSKKVCDLLAKMNVVEVGIGVESGSDVILKKNLKKSSVKANSNAVRNLREAGIRAKAFLIVGLPGETEETVKETEQWIIDNRPDDIDVSILSVAPGSVLFKNPEKFGISYQYDGQTDWYKGTPGEYKCSVANEHMSPDDIVYHRDRLERMYKDPELLK